MYCINKDEELTTQKISSIINSFSLKELPKIKKYKDYEAGKQAILYKQYADQQKRACHIVKNFCSTIVKNYQGYLTGKPITYSSFGDISFLQDVLNYNDVEAEDTNFLKNALTCGVAYEMCYIDEDGKERFKAIDSTECIPIYDGTIDNNLVYMIRFYQKPTYKVNENPRYIVEVYNAYTCTTYECGSAFSDFSFVAEEAHYFGDVPFSVFQLNQEETSIFAQIMNLQDGYNELLSSEVDEFSAFADAYMVFKGTGVNLDDAAEMREKRILILDSEDDVNYLTKSMSDTQIENMLNRIEASIYQISCSPNFSDETFAASSGIALRHKLLSFENASSAIINVMKKALLRRIELLFNVISIKSGIAFSDVEITFNRNLPVDNAEIVTLVTNLRGLVSSKTLLSIIPFVKNVDDELKRVEEENAEMINAYSFGADNGLLETQGTDL